MSALSELIHDAERQVKRIIKGNPLLGKLVKGAQIILAVYDQMYPGAVAKAQQEVLKAEQAFEQRVTGYLTGDDRRAQVFKVLLKLKDYKKVTEHDWLTIIQSLVAITPRKLGETK